MPNNPEIVFEGELADKKALELPEQYIQEVKKRAREGGENNSRAAHACLHLGIWYACGVNHPRTGEALIKKNLNEAVANIRRAGDIGTPSLALQVGECFDPQNGERLFTGKGAEKVAVYYYKLAFNRGLDKAYYKLAFCYRDGHGVRQDLDAGTKLLVLAAYRGLREAQLDFADLLEQQAYDNDAEAWRWIAGEPTKEDYDDEKKEGKLIGTNVDLQNENDPWSEIYEMLGDGEDVQQEKSDAEKIDQEVLEPESIYIKDFYDNSSTPTVAVLKSRMRFYEQLRMNDDFACKEAAHAMGEQFVREALMLLKEARASNEQQEKTEREEEAKQDSEEDASPYKTVSGDKQSDILNDEVQPYILLLCIIIFVVFMLFFIQEATG